MTVPWRQCSAGKQYPVCAQANVTQQELPPSAAVDKQLPEHKGLSSQHRCNSHKPSRGLAEWSLTVCSPAAHIALR